MTPRKLTIFLAGAAAMVVVACSSDPLVAPTSTVKNPIAFQPELRPSGGNGGKLAGSFVISPKGGDYALGDFTLHVPSGALCDLRSSYGRDHWDDACAPSRRAVSMNYTIEIRDNRVWIDFATHARFAPSTDPARWVTISTRRPVAELSEALQSGRIGAYALLYAHDIGERPVDESVDDATLITHVRLEDGLVWRRIEHFSGYTISLGNKCDPTSETCTAAGQVSASGVR